VIGWVVLRRRDTAPAAPSIKSKALLIGDSLAVGLGPPLTKALAPAKFWFVAHVSATSKDWTTGKFASGLDEALATIKPEVVFVSLGTNDTAPGANIAGLESRFKDLAGTIRMMGAAPVFLLPPELPWSRQPVVDAVKAAGSVLIMPRLGLEHASDKIHLTPKGYADWAADVAGQLKGGVVGEMPGFTP
jgi:lysophospholipase L1-like esterase